METVRKIESAVYGLAAADAVGLPAKFLSKDTMRDHPVTGLIGGGTFRKPAGTWSYSTSLALCMMDTLHPGFSYEELMKTLSAFAESGDNTCDGDAVQIPMTVKAAIVNFHCGITPRLCGSDDADSNENSAISRILPVVFYLHPEKNRFQLNASDYKMIHAVCSLTNRHPRSQVACGIYASVCAALLGEPSPDAIMSGINAAEVFYGNSEFQKETASFQRVLSGDFRELTESKIYSTSYIIDTLEAALWCLYHSDSYASSVLRAVNLGDETDSTAAVTGSLAALLYGTDSIPGEWLGALAGRERLHDKCVAFAQHNGYIEGEL